MRSIYHLIDTEITWRKYSSLSMIIIRTFLHFLIRRYYSWEFWWNFVISENRIFKRLKVWNTYLEKVWWNTWFEWMKSRISKKSSDLLKIQKKLWLDKDLKLFRSHKSRIYQIKFIIWYVTVILSTCSYDIAIIVLSLQKIILLRSDNEDFLSLASMRSLKIVIFSSFHLRSIFRIMLTKRFLFFIDRFYISWSFYIFALIRIISFIVLMIDYV